MAQKQHKKIIASYIICIFLLVMVLIDICARFAYNSCLSNIPPDYAVTVNCEKSCYCNSVQDVTDLIITISSIGAFLASLAGLVLIAFFAASNQAKPKWRPQKEQIILGIAIVIALLCPFVMVLILGE